MKFSRIIIGFLPFVLFTVLGYWQPVGWAATIGLSAAVGVIAVSARGALPMLPVVQAVVLLVFTVLGFAGGSPVDAFLRDYGRGLALVMLGLVIVVTAFTVPFTAQFTRAAVPAEAADSAAFRGVNRSLSLLWGLAVLVIGACHVAAEQVTGPAALLLHWVVPGPAVVAVVSRTRQLIARTSRSAPSAS